MYLSDLEAEAFDAIVLRLRHDSLGNKRRTPAAPARSCWMSPCSSSASASAGRGRRSPCSHSPTFSAWPDDGPRTVLPYWVMADDASRRESSSDIAARGRRSLVEQTLDELNRAIPVGLLCSETPEVEWGLHFEVEPLDNRRLRP